MMKRCLLPVLLVLIAVAQASASSSTLPNGTEFPTWEKPLHFAHTYYVNGQAANADDKGPSTEQHPFRTIGRAAQILKPGERVVIGEGVYREFVRPARGGSGPEAMISYEAAPGAKVVLKGSTTVTGWQPSTGWRIGVDPETHKPVQAWELPLNQSLFPTGYNPFEVDNVIGNRFWIDYAKDNMATYFRRRGLVFVDGVPLEPVEGPTNLAAPSKQSLNFFSEIHWSPLFKEFGPYGGKVWVEPNGMTLHIRLANDDPNRRRRQKQWRRN